MDKTYDEVVTDVGIYTCKYKNDHKTYFRAYNGKMWSYGMPSKENVISIPFYRKIEAIRSEWSSVEHWELIFDLEGNPYPKRRPLEQTQLDLFSYD